MELLLSCEWGCATLVKRELELKKLATNIICHDRIVTCTTKDAGMAAYFLQTPTSISELIGAYDVGLDLEKTVINIKEFLKNTTTPYFEGKTFSLTCHRFGNHEYTSVDVIAECARLLKRTFKEKSGVEPIIDLKNPQVSYMLIIDEKKAWFGVDLIGKDAQKRTYKVFNNPHGLKGPVAACLLMASEWKIGQSIIDPFCADGTLAIEAALFSTGMSPYHYDQNITAKTIYGLEMPKTKAHDQIIHACDAQLRNVTAAKKNAKIAGVEKSITISRMDIEWMDTKFAQESIDRIICQPLESSKHVSEAVATKLLKEFFFQAEYILTKKGTVTCIIRKPQELQLPAQEYGFNVQSQIKIMAGAQELWIVTYAKKTM